MCIPHRPLRVSARLLAALVLACALLAGGAAACAGAAPLNLRQLPAGPGPGQRAGLRSADPTPQAVAGALEQATGLTPGQVAVVDDCAAPGEGRARCEADTVVGRINRRPVTAHARRGPTFTQVFPRRRPLTVTAAVQPAGSSASAAPPTAGTPAWFQQAYDLTYLSQTQGASDTIAVVEAGSTPTAASDLATYRTTYDLSACTTASGCLKIVNQAGAATPLPAAASADWQTETALDLDAVSALCPNCHIILVETNSDSMSDLDAGVAIAQSLGAEQISNSWGSDSSAPYGTATFPGVAVLASTGDSGYAGAGNSQYPAAFPTVTAVGGTTLSAASGASSLRGFTESAWSLSGGTGGGSGCDLSEAKPSYQTDTGCTGRSYADVSADADPYTGLMIYSTPDDGWTLMGGTSLAAPLTAAYEAITGVSGTSPQWAYTDSALLNDPSSGSTGSCAAAILYICDAQTGYDGPTGAGSISGDVTAGGPGIGGPAIGNGSANTYAESVSDTGAQLTGGVYPNQLDTSYSWQYGTTTSYGAQTTADDIGSGAEPVAAPATLTGLTPSTTYHYRLVATNADGTTYGYDYTFSTTASLTGPPVSSSAPTITGNPDEGQTLTASSSWSPAGDSYTYQWKRSTDGGTTWTAITNATASTYTLAAGDLSAVVEVTVTAINGDGQASATSATVGPVVADAPLNNAVPTITGGTQRTDVLTATSGSWSGSGVTFTYAWQRSPDGTTWTTIPGAITSSYALELADEGDMVRAEVTATNASGSTTTPSAPSGLISGYPPANTVIPAVSGAAQRGATLSATDGTWTGPDNVYAFQWQEDAGEGFVDVTGATAPTYTLQLSDEGDTVRAVVSATNSDGTFMQASTPTATVAADAPAGQTAPAISGPAQRGGTLVATAGTWSGLTNVYAYQWQRSADSGTTWTAITAANQTTYVPVIADEGDLIRVQVTATNPDGAATASSPATAAITAAPPVATTAPAIAGTAQRGGVVTATLGVWTGNDNAYVEQWQSSPDGGTWTNIPGATLSTYSPVVADEGNELRMVVTATNADGTGTATSPASAAVIATPPSDTALPVLTGAPQRAQTLSVSAGAWSGFGDTYTCQWQHSSDGGTTWTAITGATGWYYTLNTVDERTELRAVVTATDPDGSASATSAASAAVTGAPPTNSSPPTITGAAVRGTLLTSTEGAWGGVGDVLGYQWQRSADGTTWTPIAGAVGTVYTLAAADEGDTVRLLITTTDPDGTLSVASAPSATVAASPPTDATAPTIVGAAVRGTLLAANPGMWGGNGDAYAYQWQRSADGGATWSNIPAATTASYTLVVADENDVVQVQVTVTNTDGSLIADSAPTPIVAAAPPVDSAVPTVTGTVARGSTLSSTNGTWTGVGNTYADQWQHSADGGTTWTAIVGANGPTYTIAQSDEGDVLRLQVTATNADATVASDSAATVVVPTAPPVSLTAPLLTGTAQRGSTLTTTLGTWGGVANGYAYQWQHSADGGTTWTNITGATNPSYAVAVADEGDLVRSEVIATNPDGTATAASAASALVTPSAPSDTTAPTIAGTPRRGSALTAVPGAWSGAGNVYTYQWQSSTNGGSTWTAITGATASVYTPVLADEGASLRVLVTATNPDGTASTASAAGVAVLASLPVDTTVPAISGTAQRTQTLTAFLGVWSGTGNVYTCQWQRSGDAGATWTTIAGATASTYTLAVADEGDLVRVLVTATNPDGAVSAPSAASSAVLSAPPVNSILPQITGAAKLGATLTATTGSWAPTPSGYAYAWQRGNAASGYTMITGATTSTYTLVAADVGQTIQVIVTATDPDASVSATSAATITVAQPPQNLTAPAAPAGTLMDTYTLTPDPGTWDSTATYTFSWVRCPGGATAITAACASMGTGPTYLLTAADIGSEIGDSVTATSPGGASTASSALTATITGRPLTSLAAPFISGDPQPPTTLYANQGTWSVPLTNVAYVWDRCDADGVSNCAQVAAGIARYTLAAADVGHTIVLIATATSPGRTATAQSAPLTIEAQPVPQPSVAPAITGTAARTDTLTATAGTWSNGPTTIAYQWERCDATGANCQPIGGATTNSYTLALADEGSTVTVRVTATNGSGSNSAAATPTAVVAALAPVVAHAAQLSTTNPQQGSLVSVVGLSWQATADTTYATVWMRCGADGASCVAIGGASASSYRPVAADVGSTLMAVVTATNPDGSTTEATPVSAVVASAAPRWHDLPILSAANPDVGTALSITPGVWTGPAVSTDNVDVMRCTSSCVVVTAAPQYTIADADIGAILRVRETASDAGGSTVVWSAQYVGPVASVLSAAAVITTGRTVLRNDRGQELAVAQLSAPARMSAMAIIRGGHRRSGTAARVVTIHRAHDVHGGLHAWVCPTGGRSGQAPQPCTRQISLGAVGRLTLPKSMSGRVRIVVVRRGR